jgi:cytochrome c553
MFKKSVIFTTAIVFILGIVIAGGISIAGDSSTGPEEMVLKTAAAKKPANFPHRKHQENFECATCHHNQSNDGKQTPYVEGQVIQKCASCHNKDMANPKLNSFKLAGHGKCKECHKKNKDTAPTKCGGCHPKKK